MAIIGVLPNNIQNGQAVDATPVMADFNFIVNQVNANANPIGTLTAPSGTRALFQQAAAPLGWTIDSSSSFTDCSMRFNNTGVGTAGTVGWSSWNFGGTFSTNAFTLSVGQLPPHAHGVNDPLHFHVSPGHTHSPQSGAAGFYTSTPTGGGATTLSGGANSVNLEATTGAAAVTINSAATGISIQNTGSGGTIQPTFTTPQVKYADVIVGIKT